MKAIVVAILLALASSEVVELNAGNFQNTTNVKFKGCCPHHPPTHKHDWFVMFIGTDCDHCPEMVALWNQLAEQYTANGTMRFGAVDCDANRQLCDSAVIHGLPSLLLFTRDGKAYRFEGHRNLTNLQNFLTGGYATFTPLNFKEPSMLEHLVHAINEYGLVGTLVFAFSVAMFLFACFSAIFKERPATNIKAKREQQTSNVPSERPISRDSSPPNRSKRD